VASPKAVTNYRIVTWPSEYGGVIYVLEELRLGWFGPRWVDIRRGNDPVKLKEDFLADRRALERPDEYFTA
jgi:hypothetical protein